VGHPPFSSAQALAMYLKGEGGINKK